MWRWTNDRLTAVLPDWLTAAQCSTAGLPLCRRQRQRHHGAWAAHNGTPNVCERTCYLLHLMTTHSSYPLCALLGMCEAIG